jgi:single-strand DNA-binding protein
MTTMKNSIQLIGNLGRDPEVTKTSSGAKIGKVSLATDESYKDKSGEWVKQTQWHNLIAWGEQADYMEANLKKGNLIGIRGKLRYNKYTDKEGQNQVRTEILVQEFLEQEEATEKVEVASAESAE